MERVKGNEAPSHTPWKYLTVRQLRTLLLAANKKNEIYRLQVNVSLAFEIIIWTHFKLFQLNTTSKNWIDCPRELAITSEFLSQNKIARVSHLLTTGPYSRTWSRSRSRIVSPHHKSTIFEKLSRMADVVVLNFKVGDDSGRSKVHNEDEKKNVSLVSEVIDKKKGLWSSVGVSRWWWTKPMMAWYDGKWKPTADDVVELNRKCCHRIIVIRHLAITNIVSI